MLRIGIDATAIPPNRVGAGNYIFNLVRGLADIDAENLYFVFAQPNHIVEWNITNPNFRFLPSASCLRLLRLAWEQTVLPILVRQHRIDVLHSPHYSVPFFNPSRSVVTFCDMTFYLLPEVHTLSKRLYFRRMISLSSRRADRIIAISESTARDLLGILRVDPKRVHAIPLAAESSFRWISDRDSIEPICSRYGLRAGEYLLYVGLLEPRKNIVSLLQAYRNLLDQGVRLRMAIVGRRGWMYNNIISTVQRLRLEDEVVFTGYVPHGELAFLYSGARLFVYPSLYEGFGLPVLEAMACGAPVVTSNLSSMAEIVGEAGLLVNPRDPRELAQAIKRLIVDESLGRSLRERGLRRAAEFSWERTARGTLQVYSKVCGSRS